MAYVAFNQISGNWLASGDDVDELKARATEALWGDDSFVEILDCGTDAQKIIDFDVALYRARERGHKTVFKGAGYAPANG
jgi:hypothetical protein